MRDYNIQPISPNMVRKPPMSGLMTSASALAVNMGSPTGSPSFSALQQLEARLNAIKHQAAAEDRLTATRMNAERLFRAQAAQGGMEHQAFEDARQRANFIEGNRAWNWENRGSLDGSTNILDKGMEWYSGIHGIGEGLGRYAQGTRPDAMAEGDRLRDDEDWENQLQGPQGSAGRLASGLNDFLGGFMPGLDKQRQAADEAYRDLVGAARKEPTMQEMLEHHRIVSDENAKLLEERIKHYDDLKARVEDIGFINPIVPSVDYEDEGAPAVDPNGTDEDLEYHPAPYVSITRAGIDPEFELEGVAMANAGVRAHLAMARAFRNDFELERGDLGILVAKASAGMRLPLDIARASLNFAVGVVQGQSAHIDSLRILRNMVQGLGEEPESVEAFEDLLDATRPPAEAEKEYNHQLEKSRKEKMEKAPMMRRRDVPLNNQPFQWRR